MHFLPRFIWIINNLNLAVLLPCQLLYLCPLSINAHNNCGGYDVQCDKEFLLTANCSGSCHLKGHFTSPNFPNNFPRGRYACTFLIRTAHSNYTYIRLHYTDFLLAPVGSKACDSKVIIYEEKHPQLAQEYCGNSRPPFLEASTGTLIVEFVNTNNGNEENIGIGFKANYEFASYPIWTEYPVVESRLLTQDSGVLINRLNPFVSTQYRDFVWIIQVNNQYQIMLTVNELYIGESQNIDCLEARDGLTSEANLLGTLNTINFDQQHGSGYLPSFLSSSGNMYVRFSSKMTSTYDIFLAVYVSVLRDTSNTGQDCEIKCDFNSIQYCVINENIICDEFTHCPYGEDENLNCDKYHKCLSEGCENGGTCSMDSDCFCPPGFSGTTCQYMDYSSDDTSNYPNPILISALVATMVLVLLTICIIGITIRRKSKNQWGNSSRQRQCVHSLSNSITQSRRRTETERSMSTLEPRDNLDSVFSAPPPYCESPPTYDHIMTSDME